MSPHLRTQHHDRGSPARSTPSEFGCGQVARLNILPIAMRMQAPMKPAIK